MNFRFELGWFRINLAILHRDICTNELIILFWYVAVKSWQRSETFVVSDRHTVRFQRVCDNVVVENWIAVPPQIHNQAAGEKNVE